MGTQTLCCVWGNIFSGLDRDDVDSTQAKRWLVKACLFKKKRAKLLLLQLCGAVLDDGYRLQPNYGSSRGMFDASELDRAGVYESSVVKYRDAAFQGYVSAEYRLGIFYLHGIGVLTDCYFALFLVAYVFKPWAYRRKVSACRECFTDIR